MVANSVYMKISGCPSRVSVAQRSDHRYVDSETLGSIPCWGSQIFRIYKYSSVFISFEISRLSTFSCFRIINGVRNNDS